MKSIKRIKDFKNRARLDLFLEYELYEAFRIACFRNRITMSQVIRNSIKKFIEENLPKE